MLQKLYLWIDEKYQQKISEREAKAFQEIMERFVQSYGEHKSTMELQQWLCMKLQEELPEYSKQNIETMADEMIRSLEQTESKKRELQEARINGVSTGAWLAYQLESYQKTYTKEQNDSLKTSSSFAATDNNTQYLQEIDNALDKANEEMVEMVTTKTGNINQNPNLDGFVAEQHHVDTFNINAETSGSPYRARVVGSNGKDSVDIEIIDKRTGKVVKTYQSKYCKNAKATESAINKGDYSDQDKVVPKGQAEEINANGGDVSEVIEAPDGTKSEPLSKDEAKDMQKEAQSGNLDNVYDWDKVSVKDAAKGVAQNALKAGIMGVGIGALSHVGAKLIKGEKIKTQEVVAESLKSGADFGVKTAAAGALKVAAEKGVFTTTLKGVSSATWTNVAFVAIENMKILADMGRGKMSVEEGIDKMGESTAAAVGGIAAVAKGTAIGASVGTAFAPPVGTTIGAFAGSIVGYMAGSEVGKAVYEGAKVAAKQIVERVKSVTQGISKGYNAMKNKLTKLFS